MNYILDACAILTVLKAEKGAEKVLDLYEKAKNNEITLTIKKINLLEVYYKLKKFYVHEKASSKLSQIIQHPIRVCNEMNDQHFEQAARLKSTYSMSLADAIAVSESIVSNATLITTDHKEIEPIEKAENIKVLWLR